jgi:hypothetical protein
MALFVLEVFVVDISGFREQVRQQGSGQIGKFRAHPQQISQSTK